MKYANKQGIRFALIIGPDEAAEGRMTLRDMKSGDQHGCADVQDAIRTVKESRRGDS